MRIRAVRTAKRASLRGKVSEMEGEGGGTSVVWDRIWGVGRGVGWRCSDARRRLYLESRDRDGLVGGRRRALGLRLLLFRMLRLQSFRTLR